MKSCHPESVARGTCRLSASVALFVLACGADVTVLAQSAEMGQELRNLKSGLRDTTPTPDRAPPPNIAEEMNQAAERATERAVQEGEASVDAAVDAAMDAVPDATLDDAEAEAEKVLSDMESGEVEPEAGSATADEATSEAGEVEPVPQTRSTRSTRRTTRGGGGSQEIKEVRVEGDVALLESLGLLDALKEQVIGQTLDMNDVRDIIRTNNTLMVEAGYYLALLYTPPSAIRDLQEGILSLEIDQGRVGQTAFYKEQAGEKVPYQGKYFSEAQLQRRLGNVQEGEPFLYDDFYKSVFTVNSHPDLTMDTDLKVRKERDGTIQRRYVDMDFTVKERIPLHAVVEVKNTGTESTEEWRIAFTVQHLNLTKHDDVLTLTLPTSIDFTTVRSLAGSYYLPYYAGNGGAFTLFGGASTLDTEDLVEDVDLEGNGWFAGFQGTYKLIANERHVLNGSLGYTYQVVEDSLILGKTIDTPREVTIGPVSLVLSYSSVRPDYFAGRNFLTSQSSINRGGVLGSSEDDEIRLQRETAEADYAIQRLQYARIQPLRFTRSKANADADGEQASSDQQSWILFLRLDGQYATGPLIPVEQKAVGGMDNVRGYKEREILADYGVSGTLELRTPIWVGDLTGGLRGGNDAAGGSERLQMVFFADGAQVYLDDALPSQKDSFSLLSVGAGFRAAITKYAQFKFDYGFPLEETARSDSSGRAHFSAEVQF